ncbi:MAG: outer membrane protein assembly factor BamA [Alphaproteobacteria bacterium]|nr:outer membrane protein assembly factor BamA [Alphaproteobacteria bacterium]
MTGLASEKGRGVVRTLVIALALLCGIVVGSKAPLAQQFGQGTIQEVRIEGTQRIEPETVRSYLSVQPGQQFSSQAIDASLKALFATGLFADVTLRREGDALIVRVVENPIINRIAFEGNKRITTETLNTEVQLRPRTVYTRTKIQADVKRILDLYRRSGRFAATVEPKVIQREQNRVDLVFEIDEGALTGVRRINFVGNKQFSDGRLREAIQTKESRWWRFLTSDDSYDPDRLTFDREMLRKFYLSEGYADFRVVSSVAELTPDREGFVITVTVDEGEKYKFGKIDVVSQLKDLDPETLKGLITTTEGKSYNADQVEATVNRLTDAVGNRGYAFVDARPNIQRDREKKEIAVTYEIQEGPRVFVERIDVVGNVRTLDKVIRREFQIVEGDAFNAAKLRRARQRIRDLGFFKKVDLTNVPGSSPDRTLVTVEVEEQSTGEISFGAGFSTSVGVLGEVSIRERNLLGRGQDLRLGFSISERSQEVDLSFTEPYFLDRNVSAGFDVFRIVRDLQDESSYDEEITGFSLRAGYQLTENLRQSVRYTLRQDKIDNVPSTASRFIADLQGSSIASIVGTTLTYDRRDSRTDPTDGYYVSLAADVAGAGGDRHFLKPKLTAGYYIPVSLPWVLSFRGEIGHIVSFDDEVRLTDRYFLGGDNCRGFRNSGVGPRDTTTRDALGGNTYYAATTELSFPLGLPQEFGLTGRVFGDACSLWDSDSKGPEVADSAAVRFATGIGLSWKSPLGPIRIDFAVPVLKEKSDRSENFRISFGTRF